MMNKPKKWLEKLNNLCLHEKVVFFSLSIILLILSIDCWLKNLPITGYGLILTTLILVGCTTWVTCHGIKWLLHCNKPLKLYIIEKSQNENILRLVDFISRKENDIFDRIFDSRGDTFKSLKYPTNLNEQIRLFLKDTERDFVKPWYSEISQNPSFLFDTHLLLEEILFKIIDKLKKVKYKNLILNILMLYLNHLQEYKKCVKKIAKSRTDNDRLGDKEPEGGDPDRGTDSKGGEVKLDDLYRYVHPGSQSDEIVNYYLTKLTKWILREHAPQEFVLSLQCKILSSILARKVLKAALVTIEDPTWINIKLINLLDSSRYEELLDNKVYVVKEKIVEDFRDADHHKKKPLIITKRYMKCNLFDASASPFKKTDFNELKNKIKIVKTDGYRKNKKSAEKGSLNLALNFNNNNYNGCLGGQGGHISSVLGGIITSTAGPLLPENVSVCYEPLNKMWQSPVREDKRDLTEAIAVPIGKTVVEGVKIDRRQSMKNKRLSRSRSTDSVSPAVDVNDSLKSRDISIGEELCENVRFTSKEDVSLADVEEERSNLNGPVKKLTKTRSFDSGSIAVDSLATESVSESEVDGKNSALSSAEDYKDGDVSPVYEEPEDFATTIAKLRSLLQQRESSSTLSDRSGQSVDLPSNSSLTDSSNKTQSTDLENSSFDSQVAPDIPTDGRPFINVCIPKTEVTTDSNGSTSVIYFIQYDGIYKLKEQNPSEEPELVLQTTVVKRKFQEFVNLQNRLEEYGNLKSVLKGIKGPSKWMMSLTLPGKTDESAVANRRQVLEVFLQQLCSKVEVCAIPELHEFLAYGYSGNKTFLKKDMESPFRRIDKLLTNKVTDVFNTIKTALPSFDFDSTNSISSGEGTKGSQDQKLLPGFLSFGNKTEEFELNFEFSYKEPTGDSMVDDIRRYLNAKTDSVENAMDVLDSNDWLAEKRECRSISPEGNCLWHNYKDLLDEDVDQLDSWLPVYSVILDILCELLDESDSWVIKEPVTRLIKVLTGHWEAKIEEKLSKLDWDQVAGNLIRLLRAVIFQAQSPSPESVELDKENTKTVLTDLILRMVPDRVSQLIKFGEVSSAVSLFVDSFQHFRPNRDVILRFFDILLVQFLSCHHLTNDSS